MKCHSFVSGKMNRLLLPDSVQSDDILTTDTKENPNKSDQFRRMLEQTGAYISSFNNHRSMEPFQPKAADLDHQAAMNLRRMLIVLNTKQESAVQGSNGATKMTALDNVASEVAGDDQTYSFDEKTMLNSMLETLEQWRAEQLKQIDRDYENLLAMEKLLLEWALDETE